MTELEQLLTDLVKAIKSQTEAIHLLANSNAMLLQAIAEDGADYEDDVPTQTYMSGEPVK
jgi:hypothetical protein